MSTPKLKKYYTAWDLAGDWWWVGDYDAVVIKGRNKYETVTVTKGGTGNTVALRYLNESMQTITRYVDPFTKMKLIRIQK